MMRMGKIDQVMSCGRQIASYAETSGLDFYLVNGMMFAIKEFIYTKV